MAPAAAFAPGNHAGGACDLAAQRALVAALQQTLQAELIETHISWVLLAGQQAWKIKKPVQLGFLDFTRLAARRHFCEEELRLNRRLAPAWYEAVQAITGSAAAPALDGPGPVLEYALRMRRFPPQALLSERLAAGTLEAAQIDALAERLAGFHLRAPLAPAASPWGRAERVEADLRQVVERLADQGLAVADFGEWLATALPALAPRWERRQAEGWVREGHGDLHLDNTVWLDGEATAFDAIEFDPALRWIDVQADLAFTVMDLRARGRADYAWRLLDRWLAHTGDHAGVTVLRPYLVYRALVRALVRALSPAPRRGTGPAAPDAEHYLAEARAWRDTAVPHLLITHGPSGSGKSHAAAALLECAGALRLRSDVERKRLFGLPPLARSASPRAGGLYSAEATRRTFARLEELADQALAAGWPVIVDAAFLRRHERDAFARLAERHGTVCAILDCRGETALLRQRIQARQRRGDDPSEADAAVLDAQLGWREPLADDEPGRALVVDANRPFDAIATQHRWFALDRG